MVLEAWSACLHIKTGEHDVTGPYEWANINIKSSDSDWIILKDSTELWICLHIRGSLSISAAVLQPSQKFREKLSICIKVFVRRYVLSLKPYEWNNFKVKYSQQTLSTAEIRVGCAPSSPCTMASAQLVWVVGTLTELSLWVGCSQCSPSAAQTAFQGGLNISCYLS